LPPLLADSAACRALFSWNTLNSRPPLRPVPSHGWQGELLLARPVPLHAMHAGSCLMLVAVVGAMTAGAIAEGRGAGAGRGAGLGGVGAACEAWGSIAGGCWATGSRTGAGMGAPG